VRYPLVLKSFPVEPTPGQLLETVLKKRGIKKTAFAREAGRTYQTIFNWCKDIGFGPEQRAEARRILRITQVDYFDAPDLVAQRENYRLAVLRKFRYHPVGKTLTDEEWRTLESIQWPNDVMPSEELYWGMVLVMRRRITPAEFQANAIENAQAVLVVSEKSGQYRPKQRGKKSRSGAKQSLKATT
jgi:hypothetical protein